MYEYARCMEAKRLVQYLQEKESEISKVVCRDISLSLVDKRGHDIRLQTDSVFLKEILCKLGILLDTYYYRDRFIFKMFE